MKNTIKKTSLVLFILLALVYAVFRYLQVFPSGENPLVYIISFVIAFSGFLLGRYLAAVFHELGHLFFGLANGFMVNKISFFFITFTRVGKKFKFSLEKNDYAGMVQILSKKYENLYRRSILVTLGGLVGSFVCILVFLMLSIFVANFYVLSFLLVVFAVSAYLFIINAIPMSENGFYNDAAVIAGLLSDDNKTKININIMTIQTMFFAGITPKEIPTEFIFNLPEIDNSDINFIQMKNIEYIYYLDKGEDEKAFSICLWLEEMLADLPEFFLLPLMSDIMYSYMSFEKDIDVAKTYYDKVKKFLDKERTICNLRIIAAYQLYVEKKARLAIATIKEAISVADDYMLSGIAKMEKNLLAKLESEAEKMIEEDERKKLRNIL